MAEEDGLTIVMSQTQLAAVLAGVTIDERETFSNRLWGGAKLIGAALEMVGAGALLLTPEPTMATKAGGAALGLHGIDTLQSGARQVWTGRQTSSLTQEGATTLARTLGAPDSTAQTIGVAVDIAVPIAVSLGVGAARIMAIRAGRVALASEEAAGGHTIARHVAKTEAELRARLAAEPRIPAATTFRSLAEAERTVYDALAANRAAIADWARQGAGATKAFEYDAGRVIGEGVVRATGQMQKMTRMVVVLRRITSGGKPYFVLTAYPKP